MKLTKMTIFTAIVAFIAIVLFNTFRQEAFLQPVTVKLFFKETAAIPVIYYIAVSFIIGLSLGTAVALIEHFTMAKRVRVLKKELKLLNKEFSAKESELSEIRPLLEDNSEEIETDYETIED